MSRILASAAGLALPWVAWELAHRAWGQAVVPSPLSTLILLGMHFQSPALWADTAHTLVRSVGGFALALLAGVVLGGAGRGHAGSRLLGPSVEIIQATPALLWVVPLVLLLGSGDGPPVLMSALVSLPLIYQSTRNSLGGLSPELIAMFRLYAPSRKLWLSELLLPLLGETLRPALTVGLALALKSALIGEWFGSRTGLGRRVQAAWAVYDIPVFYALSFWLIVLILGLSAGASGLAQILFPPRRPLAPPSSQEGTCPEAPQPRPPRGGVVVRDLHFAYPGREVFRGLSLTLEAGQSLLLCGPSGSGKTTLARLISGLLQPQAGTVEVRGRALVMFQEDALLRHRDALGNVALPLWARGDPDWRSKAQECLSLVGLCETGQFPSEMSGGMRKRLALARALAADADVLILDEPLVSLHAEARRELWALLFGLQRHQGFALIVISHFPEEIADRVDQVVRLGQLPGSP